MSSTCVGTTGEVWWGSEFGLPLGILESQHLNTQRERSTCCSEDLANPADREGTLLSKMGSG